MARNPGEYTVDLTSTAAATRVSAPYGTTLGQTLTAFAYVGSYWLNGGGQGLAGNFDGGTPNTVLFRQSGTTLQLYRRDSQNDQTGPATISNGTPAGQWITVGFCWTGTEMKCWSNGVISSPVPSTGTHEGDAGTWFFSVGAAGSGGSQASPRGYAREAAMWLNNIPNDAAITAMTQGLLHPLATAPAHYWPLDQTSGTDAIDLVGGVNLTLAANALYSSAQKPGKFVAYPIDPIQSLSVGVAPPTVAHEQYMIM